MGNAPSTDSYGLLRTYAGASFFDGFNFMNHWDYTHGFVTYVDKPTAQNMGLISASNGKPVYIGVDYTNTYDGNKNYWEVNGVGRPSVRLESKDTYTQGLFIMDLDHMPGGVCGTWPAWWTVGPNWPNSGEIDIIEGVNRNSINQAALHTGGQCTAPAAGSSQSGLTVSNNCDFTGGNGAGCGVQSRDTLSFGGGFNANRGGVYAMEWTDTSIKTWFFQRQNIPSDISSGTPNPASWGQPFADFTGNCDVKNKFANHQIVLDVTFCGDWAGNVWNDQCASFTGQSKCSVYVGSNPAAFKDMFWSINYIKVFKKGLATSTSTTTTTTRTTTTTTTKTTTTTTTTKTTTTTTTTKPTTTTTTTTTTKPTTTTTTTTTTTKPTTTTTITTTTTTTTKPTTTTTTTLKPSTTTTTTTTKPSTTTTTTTITTTKPSTTVTTTTTSAASTTTIRATDQPAQPSAYPSGAAPYRYAGCYTDSSSSRVINADSYTSTSDMTVISCRNYCYGKNYKYFGVEYGTQCFCGNTRLTALTASRPGALQSNSLCNTACVGDSSQICGGTDKLTLYVLQS